MKSLLVEDNPADAALIREMLRESPAGTFQFQLVARLDTALDRLRQETFDMVLLDLGLPDSQGLETLTLIRKAGAGLPIVVLTGLNDERFALEAMRAGAQDYLVKGRFDSELLVRTLRYAVERKRAEEEVHRLNAELERRVAERTTELQTATSLYAKSQELDRLKTDFFANISHELRTPLALILGPVRKRLAAGSMSEAERKDLELVERNAGVLLRQVNDLLDLSKLDAGGMQAAYETTDLARLGRLVASNFEVLASDRELKFLVDVPGSLPAEIDAAKIERVLVNLLSNAFKFTPAEGIVRFAIHQENDRAVVEVEDTGPGIPAHLRDVIFERFRQIDGGPNRRFGGTGLGLSIARQFVGLHGGRIIVGDARGGSGSLFRVELPLKAPAGSDVRPAAEAFGQATQQAVQESTMRHVPRLWAGALPAASTALVLVVEDNPDMNAFVSDTLSASYRVVSAFDGQEALDKTLEWHPDLIVCDIMIPGMSGDQLIRAIRARHELDDVRIVVLTAKADDQLLVQVLKEGAQDYLRKPFAAEQLLAKVDRLIADRTRMAEELERLHQLSEHLLRADDDERRQIAYELNESTAQYLAALGMNLSLARASDLTMSPKVQRILSDALSLLKLCCSDIYTMASALHPALLDHFGFEPAARGYVKSFKQRSGFEVSVDIPDDFGRLPAELELALFRIMQEALSYIRHGGESKADVRVFRSAVEVGLEVIHEGSEKLPSEGVRPEESTPGTAVAGMRERVRILGGRLEISAAGNRTTVSAVLPLIPSQSERVSTP